MKPSTQKRNFINTIIEGYQNEPECVAFVEMHGKTPYPIKAKTFLQTAGSVQAFLIQQSINRQDRVVLLAPNSMKWAACDLAILALGAISVPLYYRQEIKELAFMIDDCDAKTSLVWDAKIAKQLKTIVKHPERIHVWDHAFTMPAQELTYQPVRGEDCVTIVYTSGTSGLPKGAMISQSNVDYMLDQTLNSLRQTVDPRKEERVFHFLPVCFMGSRIMLWSQMRRHHPLWLSTDLQNLKEELSSADPAYYLNVPAVLERIRNGVSDAIAQKGGLGQWLYNKGLSAYQTSGTTSLWFKLAKAVVFNAIKKIGPSLQFLICGSAPLRPDTQTWFSMLGIRVLQVYGLTETTAIITMDIARDVKTGWVGKAIDGCEIKLSDDGELICKGPNIFLGYWHRPEDTQNTLKRGWLHTGDQAEILPTGHVRILGRVKNILVSEAGHNIVPETIEDNLLALCPGLEHVVLIGHGRPYLTAIVTGTVDRQTIQAAIDQINTSAPHYKRIKKFFHTPEPLSVKKDY